MKESEGSIISGQEGHWQKHANGRKVDAPGGCSPKDEVLSGTPGRNFLCPSLDSTEFS